MSAEAPLEPDIESYLGWLAVERGRSPRTIASYRSDLLGFEAALRERGQTVRGSSSAEIDAYLDALRASGRSAATVARTRSSLKGLFGFLLAEGIRVDDPTQGAAASRVPARLPKALSQDEVATLIDSVSGDDALSLRDRAILELLYATGARVSEVAGLDLGDLAYDEGLLRLIGKGDKERIVPLGRLAQEAIARWLAPGGRDQLAASGRAQRDDREAVFLNQRGRRISRQGIHQMVTTRAHRAGLRAEVSPHVLRHSCATHMLANGADVRVVQELLGHASVATTQLYTKVTGEHLRSAYESAHPRAQRGSQPDLG